MMEKRAEGKTPEIRAAIFAVEALAREARHFAELPPGVRPEVLPGMGRQFNEINKWLRDELQVKAPTLPLPDDVDPTTLTLAATQLASYLRGLVGEGEGIGEEDRPRRRERREPLLRIRDQKSPVEFSEVIVTSAEELKELLQTALPEWIKRVVIKATEGAIKAAEEAGKVAEEAVKEVTAKETGREGPETVSFRSLSDQVRATAETFEGVADELEDLEDEWRDAEREGELTEELKARLKGRRDTLIARLRKAWDELEREF